MRRKLDLIEAAIEINKETLRFCGEHLRRVKRERIKLSNLISITERKLKKLERWRLRLANGEEGNREDSE